MGKDPEGVSLSVLLLLLVTMRILPRQNRSKQESENASIEWFFHPLGEARTVERRRRTYASHESSGSTGS
jgi:hypothetical protein